MSRLLPLAALFIAWLPVMAEDPVANPGFEDGIAGWQVDNWPRNEVAVAPDTANPHSGAACARVELTRVVNESNLQFATGPLALHEERAVEVRFWARGVSNTAAITVMLRRTGAPYTAYFRCDATLVDEWREFAWTVVLPSGATREPVSLRFGLNATGVFWLDDVSVRELPSESQDPPPTANPVRNGSFEAGCDGWSATVREREFPEAEAWKEAGSNAPCPAEARLESVAGNDSPHGLRHLEVNVPEGSYATLTSAFFPARYGHRVKLGLSLRGDGGGEIAVGIGGGKNGNARFQNRNLPVTPQWQRQEIDARLKPVEGGLYCLQVAIARPGRYAIDDVTLVEDGAEGVDLHPASAAVAAAADAPAGNLYGQGQGAAFDLVLAGLAPGAAGGWTWRVEDHLDRTVAEGSLAVTADDRGGARVGFAVPTDRFGAFRIGVRRSGAAEAAAEQLYSVLPDLAAPAERPDSYFGGHVDLTPYNLEIARRAGFRWLRLHPPMCTKWMVVEPSPGAWDFRTAAVAAAHRQGFRILGTLDTAPIHAALADPERTTRPRWSSSGPPADLAAWRHYVEMTVRAFAGSVDAWELWNEPDGGFLRVPRGTDKAPIWLGMLGATREALDAVAPQTVLIGPALATPSAPFGSAILDGGAGDRLDAFSFHCYALSAGGASPDDGALLPLLARWRGRTDRHGQPLAAWCTEGGVWLPGGQSRLATWRVPPSSAMTPSQAAAALVRAALLFKAAGVARWFDFQAWASPSGRRSTEDNTCGFIEVTGIPGAGVAAHAAMVSRFEEARPDGFHVVETKAGTVREARFALAGGRLSAWWGAEGAALAGLVGAGAKAWDMMGNPLPLTEARCGEYPVYTLSAAP